MTEINEDVKAEVKERNRRYGTPLLFLGNQAVLCQEIKIAYKILISGHHTACDRTGLSVCLCPDFFS